MLKFLFGYALGSNLGAASTTGWRLIGIIGLVFLALCGIGWVVVARMDLGEQISSCGGGALEAMVCRLQSWAELTGIITIGLAAAITIIWIAARALGR